MLIALPEDNEMLFAILILMILATAASVWYGNAQCTVWFVVALLCIATVLISDIDTPLHLSF
ncbi:hypothetical protein D9O50_04700 [Oxalobacteraceae bacterium CAVE-383]|nr:hypothetical protein D9O50_04700 [Oxalobacteraceae bacterium CAVE-383]